MLAIDPTFDNRKHLLAFSGGPDSVYLLRQLAKRFQDSLPDHVQLAYVNYHDSPYVDAEERIVLDCASSYNLVLHKKVVFYKKEFGNFEDWARKIRYRFFADICSGNGLADVLTAHHKDDSIETFLLQKERNALPSHYGLRYQSQVEGVLVLRPLLSVWKKDIQEELKKEKAPYYEDITNHDGHTRRNLLRRELDGETKVRLLEEMTEANERLSSLLSTFKKLPERISFSCYDAFSEEEKQRLAFFLLDKKEGFLTPSRREGLAREILEFLKGRKDGLLTLERMVLYRTEKDFFIHEGIPSEDYEFLIDKPMAIKTPFMEIDIQDPDIFNHLSFPFVLRNPKPMDKIGTDLSSKDVHTFLRRQKVPFYLRRVYPIFLKDGVIRFVPFYKDILERKVPIRFLLP